ncbi:hypothetical protein ACROYT_G031023 [Oculina patagonica]
MASCNYSALFESVSGCGSSSKDPQDVQCVVISDCNRDVSLNLKSLKIGPDEAICDESTLLLARAGIFRVEEHHLSMIICPHHREKYGLRWRCGKVRCGVPNQLAGHQFLTAKGDRRMNSRESSFVFIETGERHPVGTHATSLEASSCLLVPSTSETEYDTDHSESSELESAQEGEMSTTSEGAEELTMEMECLQIGDESFVPSSQATSKTSSSIEIGQSPFELKRQMNAFLEEYQIKALGKPWLSWTQASAKTRERYVASSSEIVSSVLKVVYPDDPASLWLELQTSTKVNVMFGSETGYHPSERCYLEALAESYNNASSWDTRRQILSCMAGVASYKAIATFIPGLSQYRYTIANLHRLHYGRAVPVPKQPAPRLRITNKQLDHFLCFITSPHLVQDLPFGEKNLRLSSGQYIEVPDIIRTLIPQRIVKQYKQYCSDTGFAPFSESTMLRILSECSASVRKSLQGLDYFAAEGARAFDVLSDLLQQMLENGANKERVVGLQEALKAGKLYLKCDFKVHISDSSPVAEHCSCFSLSDSSDPDLRLFCNHSHDEKCDQCATLGITLADIEKLSLETAFSNENDRDEVLFLCQNAKLAIQSWKCHLMRTVRQYQARLDVLALLDESTVLVVNDWAMEFLPQKVNGELQSQGFINVIQSSNQESSTVVVILQHVINTLKVDYPEIKRVFLRQDNAGCYHSASTVLACPAIEKTTGVKVDRLDFSDPQGGKGAADRLAATAKSHIRMYVNEGHDVTTAQEMQEALLSHGGIEVFWKAEPEAVAREMRRALDSDGKRLCQPTEFLTVTQITSFFSRLAAKVRKQVVPTEDDICAAQEESNFCEARQEILTSIQADHPITFDQYNICEMVKNNTLKKLKLGLLQMLCEKFELEFPSTGQRKKAPYIAMLEELVAGCSCGGRSVLD